jgi:hypothetical protein
MTPSPANTAHQLPADPEAMTAPVDYHNVVRGSGGIALAHETDTDVSVFEAAKQHEHVVSDELAVSVLQNRFQARTVDGKHSGQNANFLKIYLDQVEASRDDHNFVTDPNKISGVHNQIADLIGDKLRVYVKAADPNDARAVATRAATMTRLRDAKANYLQKLENDKSAVRTFANDVIGKPNDIVRAPVSALEFKGFDTIVKDADGTTKKVDLLRKAPSDVRPNMQVQEEAGQTFVHWSSSEYMQKRINGEKTDFKKRIYLNPQAESSVAVFKDIIEAADAQGLNIKGKFFDRASNATSKSRVALKGEDFMTRADGIVLYAADDADTLMAIVGQVYAKHQSAFEGRGMSAIPFQLKEGLAVGDEPMGVDSSVSLTSSRLSALAEASDATRQDLGIKNGDDVPVGQKALAANLFKKHFAEAAKMAGIDQHNIAFNAEPGAPVQPVQPRQNIAPSNVMAQPRQPEKTVPAVNELSPQALQKAAGEFFKKGLSGNFLDNRQATSEQQLRLKKMNVLIDDGDQDALEDFASIRKTILNIKNLYPEGTASSTIRAEIINRSMQAIQKTEAMLANATDPEVRDEVARRMLRASIVIDSYGGVVPAAAKIAHHYLSDRMRRR